MSSEPETTRIVRSWLEEGVTDLPDRVLDAVIDQLPATPQRRAWWPARRMPEMTNAIKLAIGAAAVVVASVVGLSLISGGSAPGVGGPAASPSPSPSASPSPSPTPAPSLRPEPSPVADSQPSAGELQIGRHSFRQNGVAFSLDFTTSGWSSSGVAVPPDGGTLTKASGTPQYAWILLWSIDGVFSDPCGQVAGPVLSPSAADLAGAVAAIPGVDVIEPPTDVTLGGRPARHVVIQVRDDIDCSPPSYFMWYDDVRCGGDDPCHRWATAERQINRIWIFEVDGTHVWIEAETFSTATPETIREVEQLIESIEFE